jgi:hypothetical protein
LASGGRGGSRGESAGEEDARTRRRAGRGSSATLGTASGGRERRGRARARGQPRSARVVSGRAPQSQPQTRGREGQRRGPLAGAARGDRLVKHERHPRFMVLGSCPQAEWRAQRENVSSSAWVWR